MKTPLLRWRHSESLTSDVDADYVDVEWNDYALGLQSATVEVVRGMFDRTAHWMAGNAIDQSFLLEIACELEKWRTNGHRATAYHWDRSDDDAWDGLRESTRPMAQEARAM